MTKQLLWQNEALRPCSALRSRVRMLGLCGRKGVAQALVKACEGVAAAANFLDIYIQAAAIQRDSSSLLGSWLSQEYQVRLMRGWESYCLPLTVIVAWQTFGQLAINTHLTSLRHCQPQPHGWA